VSLVHFLFQSMLSYSVLVGYSYIIHSRISWIDIRFMCYGKTINALLLCYYTILLKVKLHSILCIFLLIFCLCLESIFVMYNQPQNRYYHPRRLNQFGINRAADEEDLHYNLKCPSHHFDSL
jgi:hypothetical protein